MPLSDLNKRKREKERKREVIDRPLLCQSDAIDLKLFLFQIALRAESKSKLRVEFGLKFLIRSQRGRQPSGHFELHRMEEEGVLSSVFLICVSLV